MNLEYKKELLQKGIDDGNLPKILYKYRTTDQALKILDNFSFWFATPDSFNDPFDCNLSEIKTPSLEHARKHFTRLGFQEKVIAQSIDLFQRHPEKLIQLVKDTKKTFLSKGVLSLSEVCNDILMWSHYSEYHTGVVLGLRMEVDLEFFISPIKIDYQDTYEVLNYLDDPEKSTKDTIKIKSSQWKYEHEIRIYKNNSGLHKIDKSAINEIYFGIKTSEEDIDKIYSLCKEKGLDHVKFFKGNQSHGSFEVLFEEI